MAGTSRVAQPHSERRLRKPSLNGLVTVSLPSSPLFLSYTYVCTHEHAHALSQAHKLFLRNFKANARREETCVLGAGREISHGKYSRKFHYVLWAKELVFVQSLPRLIRKFLLLFFLTVGNEEDEAIWRKIGTSVVGFHHK